MFKRKHTKYVLCLFIGLSSGLLYSQKSSQAAVKADGTPVTGISQGLKNISLNSLPATAITNPNCNTTFYAQTGAGVYECNTGIVNSPTLTSLVLPPGAGGFAVGPSFGFPAPNPTFWTTSGGTFWYYDGTNFINTGHSNGNASAVNIGGSKNFLYNLVGGTGQVYKYNGTGAATLLATIPALALGGPYDLTGDDQDNFYYLRTQTPQSLNVYDPNGVLTCSFSLSGIPPAPSGGGFAIVGNTVTANTGIYYVGIISGSTVNFSTSSMTLSPLDFANCYINTTFNSTITANPTSTLTCTTPSLTLTASTTVSPVTYTWSGPGIISPINNPTVLVNSAGVYTCSLTATAGCPQQTSISTFTVYGGTGLLTPTISSTGSLTCNSPTTQLSVAPNSVTNTILWNGPGIIGANNTPTISVNAAGIYSVTLTNTVCSGTATFNVLSGISPLTLVTSASATQICTPGSPATLSVTGAANYTWSPATSVVPSTGSLVVASPTVTTTYSINGTNGVCSGSTMITVSVNATPTVMVTSGSPTICAGTTTTLSATGASTYTWNPGNLTGAVITVTPPTTTAYTVIGANGSCTAAAVTTLIVIPGPTVSVGAAPIMVCAGNSSTLSASGAISYTWQPGNLNGSSITVTPAITTVYTVSGTALSGCVSSSTLSLAVISNPTIIISPASPTVCAGSSSTLTATGAVNYTWSPGGTTGSSIIITPTANTSYTVNGDNGTCPGAASVFITVNSNPTITPSASSTLVCSAGSVTLSAGGASSYTWIPGNATSATVVVSPTITSQYTVTGITGLCTDIKTILITVNNGPTVTIASSPTTICSASGASATLSASGGISYIWNPGGILGSAIVITPTVTTTYSVISSDAMGCVSTTTVSYSVTPTPTINATATSTSICIGKSTTLTATGAGTYTWNPGSSNSNTINVSPIVNTIYTVSGTNGNCTSSSTISIIVNSNPTITASSSPTLICSGNSSTLNASGASTYTWLPGSLVGQTVNVSPTSTTNYSVTGMSIQGCTASAVVSLSVNATPTVTVASTPTAICQGSTATISVSGATGYTWSPGGSNASSITVSPTITSTYSVTGVSNNCTNTKTITLIVNPTPTINAVSNSTAVCAGNNATLTGIGGSTYTWNPGALTGSTAVVSPTTNTTYTVTGASSFGCINSATVTLMVNANPTITASSNPTFICRGSGVSATLTAVGANTYTWNPGNLSGSPVTVNPTITTTYSVTGTNTAGCTNSQTVSVTILPSPTITINSSTSPVCSGNSVTLTANGATTYTWHPAGPFTSTIVVTPSVTTVYTVTGHSGNCNRTRTYTLVVLPKPNINITALPPIICNGGSGLLLALGATNYTWSPTGANGNTLIITPNVTATYTVTGTNPAGCSNTAVTTVTVNPTPTITTIPSATQVCSGTSVTLTSNGAITYVAQPGTQTGSVIVVTPTVTTSYTISGVNLFGCTDSKVVIVSVLPNPTITAQSSGTLLCDGGSFSLSATGATNYTWMPLGINGSSVVTTATSSINSYTLLGESGGCTSKTVIAVQVINCNNTIFGITKAAGTPTLVYNEFYNVSFSITAVNVSSLNLTNIILNEDLAAAFPAPAIFTVINQPVITSHNSSLVINPLFDGVSQRSLTSPLTSTLLPGKRDTIVFTIRIDPKQFFGPYKNSVIGFADFLNSFTVADSSNDGFAWDPDQDGDPTNNDIPTIINLPYSELFIPNGFSPDDDGKNDLFVIKGLNGRKVKLTIFNRWGNKVYEKSEYDNSWNAVVNTGGITLGNNKVPPSTYYYILEFLDGDKETRTGFVVIQY